MAEVTPHGWASDVAAFRKTPASEIRRALNEFVRDASPEQVRAWDESIPPFQREFDELTSLNGANDDIGTIWEYELPLEFRRSDVLLLLGETVVVLELKSKSLVSQADLDQVAAYARDMRAYHRDCEDRAVLPVLVLMRAEGALGTHDGVEVVGPDAIDALVAQHRAAAVAGNLEVGAFLEPDAYRPLPSLVEAARELMEHGDLRRIHRAHAATDPTLQVLREVAHDAARTKSRHLVLITGLPGSGKTLVGLQLAHARYLDDLAVPRSGGRPTSPAVFLSGNGPLVEVLQYELRSAGGSGKTFVRDVKAYVERYSSRRELVPPEHVLIFDEAQRAFDAEQTALKHGGRGDGKSEPEHFVDFAERVPDWCVVVGLIGTGQEIHVGEEGGLEQWRAAVEGAGQDWQVHVPEAVSDTFSGYASLVVDDRLNLNAELRYHLATDLHGYVAALLGESDTAETGRLAASLEGAAYHLRITRDLGTAKDYLRSRYADDPQARFGMIASARDSLLWRYGVPNSYDATKRVRNGPWFSEGEGDPSGRSCRNLRECVTEFGCQGLELDAALLAWGNDFIRRRGAWTNEYARKYQRAGAVRDAFRLRRNAYRVLLTRGRDGTVVYVPDAQVMDETYDYLAASGFRPL